MFTGIIQSVGRIAALEPRGADLRLRVDAPDLPLGDAALGDSIAVNGVCLTAVELTAGAFAADVSVESLNVTTLAHLKVGAPVNLETALLPTTRLGGHLVSGHVDGIGEVVSRRPDARSERFEIRVPNALARYVAAKGSVCVDGVSLTVNAVQGSQFGVNIVPHTLQETIIDGYAAGTAVNIEVDIIARYLERLLTAGETINANGLAETLKTQGFMQ